MGHWFVSKDGTKYWVDDSVTNQQQSNNTIGNLLKSAKNMFKGTSLSDVQRNGYNINYLDNNSSFTGKTKEIKNRQEEQLKELRQERKDKLAKREEDIDKTIKNPILNTISKGIVGAEYLGKEAFTRVMENWSTNDDDYSDDIEYVNEQLSKGNYGDAFDGINNITTGYFGVRLSDSYSNINSTTKGLLDTNASDKLKNIYDDNMNNLNAINEALYNGTSEEDKTTLEKKRERLEKENQIINTALEIQRYNIDNKISSQEQVKENDRTDDVVMKTVDPVRYYATKIGDKFLKIEQQTRAEFADMFDADTAVGRMVTDGLMDLAEMGTPGGALMKGKIYSTYVKDADVLTDFVNGEATGKQALGAALDIGATIISEKIQDKLSSKLRKGMTDKEYSELVNKTTKELASDFLKKRAIDAGGEAFEEAIQEYGEALRDGEEINQQTLLNALQASMLAFGSTFITGSIIDSPDYIYSNKINKQGGLKYTSITVGDSKTFGGQNQVEYNNYTIENISNDLKDGKMAILTNQKQNVTTQDGVLRNAACYIFPSEQAFNEYTKGRSKAELKNTTMLIIDPSDNDFDLKIKDIYNNGFAAAYNSKTKERDISYMAVNNKMAINDLRKTVNEINSTIEVAEGETVKGIKINKSTFANGDAKAVKDDLINQVLKNDKIQDKKEAIKKLDKTVNDAIVNKITRRSKLSNIFGKNYVFVPTTIENTNRYILKEKASYDKDMMLCEVYSDDNLINGDATSNLKLNDKDVNLLNDMIDEGIVEGNMITNNPSVKEVRELIENNPDMEKEILQVLGFDGIYFNQSDNSTDKIFIMANENLDTRDYSWVNKVMDAFDKAKKEVTMNIEQAKKSRLAVHDNLTNWVLDKDSEYYKSLPENAKKTAEAISGLKLPRTTLSEDFAEITVALSKNFDLFIDFFGDKTGENTVVSNVKMSGAYGAYSPAYDAIYIGAHSNNSNHIFKTMTHEILHCISQRSSRNGTDTGQKLKDALVNFSYLINDSNGKSLGEAIKTDVDSSYKNEPGYTKSMIEEEYATFAIGNLFSNDLFIDAFIKRYPDESRELFTQFKDIKEVLKKSDITDSKGLLQLFDDFFDAADSYNKRMSNRYGLGLSTDNSIIYDTVLNDFTARKNTMQDNSNLGGITESDLYNKKGNTDGRYQVNIFGDVIQCNIDKTGDSQLDDARSRYYTMSIDELIQALALNKTSDFNLKTWKQGDEGVRITVPNLTNENLDKAKRGIKGIINVNGMNIIPLKEDIDKVDKELIKKALGIRSERDLSYGHDLNTTEVIDLGGDQFFINKEMMSAEEYQYYANATGPEDKSVYKTAHDKYLKRVNSWYGKMYARIFAKTAPAEFQAAKYGDIGTMYKLMRYRHALQIAANDYRTLATFANQEQANVRALGDVERELKRSHMKDTFEEWFMLKYNEEVIKNPTKGYKYRVTDKDYEATMRRLQEIETKNTNFDFEGYANLVRQYRDYQLEYLYKAGLITEGNYYGLKKSTYKYYMPIYDKNTLIKHRSDFDIIATVGSQVNNTLDNKSQYISEPAGLFEAFQKRQQTIVQNALKNDAVKEMALNKNKIYKGDGGASRVSQTDWDGRTNNFGAYIDGQYIATDLDSRIAGMFGQSPWEQKIENFLNKPFMRAIAKSNALHTGLQVAFSPVFIAKNLLLDSVSGFRNGSEYRLDRYIINYNRALYNIFNNTQYAKELEAEGIISTRHTNKFARLFDNFENVPKMAEYLSAIDKGYNQSEAALMASDVNMDNTRGGWLTKKLSGRVTSYLNISTQALDKEFKTIHGAFQAPEDLLKLLFKYGQLLLPALFNVLTLENDEQYLALNSSTRLTNFIIKVGDNKFIKIPLGREIIATNVITQYLSNLTEIEDDEKGELFLTGLTQMLPAPVQETLGSITKASDGSISGQNGPFTAFIKSLQPQAINNFESIWINKNYYGQSIYNEDGTLSEKAKDIGKYIIGTYGFPGKLVGAIAENKIEGTPENIGEDVAKSTGMYTNNTKTYNYKSHTKPYYETKESLENPQTLNEIFQKKYYDSKNAEINDTLKVMHDCIDKKDKETLQQDAYDMMDYTLRNYQHYDAYESTKKNGIVVYFEDRVFFYNRKTGKITNITNKNISNYK